MKRPPRPRLRFLSVRGLLAIALACQGLAGAPLSAAPRRPAESKADKAAKAPKADAPDKPADGGKPVRAALAVEYTITTRVNRDVYSEADCIALAARQNPDVLGAAKRVDAARAAITTAKSQIYPAVTATGYYQRRDQSIANGGAVTSSVNGAGQTVITAANFNRPNDYYGDVRLSQSLYSGGAVRGRIGSAKLQTEVAGLDYQTQLDTTTLAVRSAFYQTLFAEANIGVRQQAVDLLAAQVKDQRDRLAAGSVGQINVNRTEVALANERPPLLDALAALNTAYATLAQALGVSYAPGSLQAPFRVRGTLEVRPVKMTLAECMARAQAARPEVQARLLAIDVLKQQLAIDKSANRPQVTAFAAYDVYSEPDIRTVDDSYSGYTLGLAASWTLFDGFATRGRVRTTQAQIGEAESTLAASRKQVENDVYTAYSDLRTAESSLRPLADNTRLSVETLDLITKNFDAGLTTQLDVLQARVDVTRSRSLELGGRLAYNLALARLERAMALGRPVQGGVGMISAGK